MRVTTVHTLLQCHSIGKALQVQSLNCIVQLVVIMQLSAKPQHFGRFPSFPSFSSLVAFLDDVATAAVSIGFFNEHVV